MNDINEYIKTATVEGRTEKVWCNGISYTLVTKSDGWISIIGFENGEYTPLIQAKNRDKALDYINLIEPITAPTQALIKE